MTQPQVRAGAPAATQRHSPLRVMVVDDSAVVRGILVRTLEVHEELLVVASVANGEIALRAQTQHKPDVILLDIEMPVMDGLTALPKLMAADPWCCVIMVSTLTRENAVVTMQALKDGAADYLTKPTSAITAAESFRRDLLGKIIGLGQAHRDRRRQGTTLPAAATDARAPTNAPAATRPPGSTIPAATPATRPTTAPRASAGTHVPLRHSKAIRAPAALAIGSSTGGPQALIAVFEALEVSRQQPIFITQHMPPTFTAILAEQLTNHGKWACHEGADGMAVEPGHAYIAPGDYHMTVQDKDGHKVIRLNQDAAENYCRPSVDVMLRSITKAYAGSVVAVILTGMGQDGLAGGRHLVDAGGHVVAQDEASSVVWGMPGAVATAGICDAILPLADVAGYINRLVAGAPS